jgi:hypothetical protein
MPSYFGSQPERKQSRHQFAPRASNRKGVDGGFQFVLIREGTQDDHAGVTASKVGLGVARARRFRASPTIYGEPLWHHLAPTLFNAQRQPGAIPMDTDSTPPNEGTVTGSLVPNNNSHTLTGSFVPPDDHLALTGNASMRSMAAGGVTQISGPPLTLQQVDPSIFSNGDQPQPSRRPRSTFDPGGPAEPPFPPPAAPVHNLVARDIIIGRAVNQVAIRLAAVCLLNALDAKLEALREARSNSEDAAVYENLKRLVEAFLAAQEKTDEKPVVESTLSLAAGFRNWWFKDHESICKKTMNIGLFTGGLTVCALAGVLSDASVVTVGALVGGRDVVGALTALAKMLPGKD